MVVLDRFRDRRSGADRGARADPDRCDQLDPGTDKRTVANRCLELVCAIVVAGNRSCTDVNAFSYFGVADVGQVIDLAAIRNRALLDFDKVAELHPVGQFGAGTHSCKRSDLAILAGCPAFEMAV